MYLKENSPIWEQSYYLITKTTSKAHIIPTRRLYICVSGIELALICCTFEVRSKLKPLKICIDHFRTRRNQRKNKKQEKIFQPPAQSSYNKSIKQYQDGKKGQKPSSVGLFQSKETSSPSSSFSRRKNINAIKKETTFFWWLLLKSKSKWDKLEPFKKTRKILNGFDICSLEDMMIAGYVSRAIKSLFLVLWEVDILGKIQSC